MDGFQSLFDVDTDALKVADFDSVFGNSADSSEQFDNIFGAEEDDRLMEAVIGFTEDGTELPDEDELHNNEEGDLGEDGVTPKNFGDGIFDDETDNAPKCDASDNADVIDRRGGAEGTQNVLNLDCPKTGVQDNGSTSQIKSDNDVEHLDNAAESETNKAGKDMQDEIDDTVNEAADFYDSLFEEGPVEGTQPVTDLGCPKSGVQDNGNTAEVDSDDDVEHLTDAGEKETNKAGEEGAKEIEDTTVDEAADFYNSLLEEDIPDVGAEPEKDDLGLPAKDGNEGEIKDANTEYQDDLDESFLAEADEDDDDEDDSKDSSCTDESALFGEDANSLDQEDDADIGLPVNNGTEGKIGKDKDYQDDLDENCLFESDDTEDDDTDGGDDEDDPEDSGDDGLDFGGDDSDTSAGDDLDFGDDEDDPEDEDLEESYLSESDDTEDKSSEKAPDVENAAEDDTEDPGNKSTNEAADFYNSLFEDTDIQDELNDVVDDEEKRDGAEPAVDTKEGEEAPADDLDEGCDYDDSDEEELKEFAEFITEDEDLAKDDSPVDEAIDDDAIETVDDNSASGEGPLDLDYDASDDELFDDSVEED